MYYVRRCDDAIVQLQNALRTTPESPVAHCGLWHVFTATGRSEQALTAAEGCVGHYSPDVKRALARGSSDTDYRGAMRRVADLLAAGISGGYVAPVDVVISYLYAGQKDLALEWLSMTVDARDPNSYAIAADPQIHDAFPQHARLQDLLRRMNLPR
jgi:hypothetical protein